MIKKLVIFIIIFFITFYWLQIVLFISSITKNKTPITILGDKAILDIVQKKAEININKVKIAESEHPFGMMIGIPGRPQLILSRGLYNTFFLEEIEYVVLHEVGHYKLGHTLKELFLFVILLVGGIFLIRKFNIINSSYILILLLGLLFGIIMIKIGKIHEVQADQFALDNISDPKGMITATIKFKEYNGPKYSENKNKILQFLFYRSNPYKNRIEMAEKKLLLNN